MDGENRTCCICGHPLDYHIDEIKWWRCHAIGNDQFQCECHLDKGRAVFNIDEYCLEKRIEEYKKGRK